MLRKILFLMILTVFLAGRGLSATPLAQMEANYSRLSVMFNERTLDGIMSFISKDYVSDMGWNREIFKLSLDQLFQGYGIFQLETDSIEVLDSQDTTKRVVKWKGHWHAETLSQRHIREQFPSFGSQYLPPFDKQAFQYHQWSLEKGHWLLSKVWVDSILFKDNEPDNRKKSTDYFIRQTGPLGIAFGKNLTHSIDSGSMLLVQGMAPSCALSYLRESSQWRQDITYYGEEGWFNSLPMMDEATAKMKVLSPMQKGLLEIRLINNTGGAPIYSVLEKNYNGILDYIGKRRERIYSVPRGMVFSLETGKPEAFRQEDIDGLIPLDSYFTDSSQFMQRELIANYHFMKARNYLYARDTQKVRNEFELAGKIGFDVEGMNYNLAVTMERYYKDVTAAADYAEKECIYYPWNISMFEKRGELDEKAGRLKKAIEAYEIALRFDSENSDIQFALGNLYEKDKNWNAAIHKYQQVTALSPYDPESRLRLARLFEKNKNWEESLKFYKETLKILEDSKDSRLPEIQKKVKDIESQLKNQ